MLINETLAKRLGFTPQTAVGQRLYTQYPPNPLTYVEVAGVMKDFNYSSLHGEVKPFMLVYSHNPNDFSYIVASTDSKSYKDLLGKIENDHWHRTCSAVPFEYAFLDAEVQRQYETEITLSKIINSFTMMAILISCPGFVRPCCFQR